jgi:phosphoribosylpyrophosphate synthetase
VGRTYLAKHTTRTVRATVRAIRYRVDVNSAEQVQATRLEMNDIAEVEFETSLPLFFDAYADNREMGALILMDAVTNATVGAAMIVAATETREAVVRAAAFVWLRDAPSDAETLVEALRERGRPAVMVDDALIPEGSLAGAVRALQMAGVTAVSARAELSEATLAALRDVAGEAYFESASDALEGEL